MKSFLEFLQTITSPFITIIVLLVGISVALYDFFSISFPEGCRPSDPWMSIFIFILVGLFTSVTRGIFARILMLGISIVLARINHLDFVVTEKSCNENFLGLGLLNVGLGILAIMVGSISYIAFSFLSKKE